MGRAQIDMAQIVAYPDPVVQLPKLPGALREHGEDPVEGGFVHAAS